MRQMKSRTIHLGILAAAAFLLLLIQNPIKAYAFDYPISVGGKIVESINKDNILGTFNSEGQATASYDPDTNTLTLRDADIKGYRYLSLMGTGAIYVSQGMGPLTITGNARIQLMNGNGVSAYGIFSNEDIVLEDCNLDITGKDGGIFVNEGRNITVLNSTISINSTNGDGIFMNKGASTVTFRDSAVSIVGKDYGIIGGTVTIDGGEAKVRTPAYGIRADSGGINITSRTKRVVVSSDSGRALAGSRQTFLQVEAPLQVVTPEGSQSKWSGDARNYYLADADGQGADYVLITKPADYKFVRFDWEGNDTEGYAEASAVYVNKDTGEVVSLRVDLDSEVTQPTCEEDGYTTYTAVIDDPAMVYDGGEHVESQKGRLREKTGHKWGDAVYSWAWDNSYFYAIRYCMNDSRHREDEQVNTTSEVTVKPTCTEAGTTVWTSDPFKNEAFTPRTASRSVPEALGHDWGEWEVTAEATCEEAGSRTHTCKRMLPPNWITVQVAVPSVRPIISARHSIWILRSLTKIFLRSTIR